LLSGRTEEGAGALGTKTGAEFSKAFRHQYYHRDNPRSAPRILWNGGVINRRDLSSLLGFTATGGLLVPGLLLFPAFVRRPFRH
jgi:hypothetical protein